MRLEPAPSFNTLTTLRLGGRALALARITRADDLASLSLAARREGGDIFIIGRGSNLLAADGEHALMLTRWDGEPELRLTAQTGDRVCVRASANVPLPRLVAFGAAHGCAELAALAGIPGEVGGAMVMNAGSCGTEFARLVRRCTVFTPERGITPLEPETGFIPEYRHTRFFPKAAQTPVPQTPQAAWPFILDVELELTVSDRACAVRLAGEHIRLKAAAQPVRSLSAGCVFKNPPPDALAADATGHMTALSAGKLLDAAGFRGKTLGGVGFSSLHANFLVNHGSGTATEALTLMEQAREAVFCRFGIRLETEVRVITW